MGLLFLSLIIQASASGTGAISPAMLQSTSTKNFNACHPRVASTFWPWGVAVDASGNLYVTDEANNVVWKFSPTGSNSSWGSYGSGSGQFNDPRGIAVSITGNVYVVDAGNNRVEEFTSSGSYITQWGLNGSGNGQFVVPRG
ncbi:MAG TPA: 6-bladed beta-propeller, partial [Candidatus Lokiarchaeia archaeon]|nr:6-bladed beta-propeller [Candidatus Lokiarchaeia archaeon]